LKKKKKEKPKLRPKRKIAKRATGKNGEAKLRDRDGTLREQLANLLKGGGAHIQVMDALEGFPPEKRGTYANGLPHTGWQLLEHLRIAQWDILEFSRNPRHVSPEFPEGYWPKTPAPRTEEEWTDSVWAFRRDLRDMVRLVENGRVDLYALIPNGQGKTLLREALVLADHNSYHLGQLVDLRRALGEWPGA
jgi:hypothetical protein